MNEVIQGDCLDVMRGLDSETVDLAYADPPFATGRDFGAFDDRWESLDCYRAWLTARLVEMRRLLKPTGSIYVHCDWHANHHVRLALDEVFGYGRFQNEIVWCYASPMSPGRRFGRKHDTVYFYTVGSYWTWNESDLYVPYRVGPNPGGFIGGGMMPGIDKERRAEYLARGRKPFDWWEDCPPLRGQPEGPRYPSQKPLSLLERIIKASSNEGDLVLDPFCGGGTTLVAAEKLNRRYLGIDASPAAVAVARERLGELHPRLF